MTANVMQEDVQQYFEAGMNGYISKPFHEDELILKMDEVMKDAPADGSAKKEEPVVVVVKNEEPALPPMPEKVTDMQFLRQLTGGNNEKMQKYIGMFLDNAPKLLDSIDKGMENRDFPTVKIAAHSLKPQLSYMGVKEDVSKIFMIEQSAGSSAHFDSLPALIANLKRLCTKAFEELRQQY
jgi:HPt (histidine-containing phosphotransfer) domain-containing protein